MKKIMIRREIQKLLGIRMIPAVFALFLLLNIMVISSMAHNDPYIGYVADFAERYGIRISSPWLQNLESEEESTERARLIVETAGTGDIYKDFDTMSIYRIMQEYWPMCRDQQLLENKYRTLQKRADDLSRTDEAMDVSAAGETHRLFSLIFSQLLPMISAETILLAAAAAAALSTYESNAGTAQIIFSRAEGRSLYRLKYAVSLCAAVCMAVLLFSEAFLQLALSTDLSSFLSSSVSSLFNYRLIVMTPVPFITWIPMNNLQCFIAHCALSLLLGMTVHGFCFAAGCFLDSTLKTIALFLGVNTASLCLIMAASRLHSFLFYSLSMLSPAAVWMRQYAWFTDGDIGSVIPMQETVTVLAWLLAAALTLYFALKSSRRKDIL